MTALLQPQVQAVLQRLHSLADANDDEIGQRVRNSPASKSATAQERASLLKEVLMPVSRDAGTFLYGLVRSTAAKRVVEFGTSFGISTIYFAAALKDNGGGLVIGSELEPTKVAKANQHLIEAGLSEFVDIRAGDARETLLNTGEIDLLFLDGWKELYLDILKITMTNLRPGSVVLADDIDLFPDQLTKYLDFVRDQTNGFVSVYLPLGDGIEYSVKC
ncbi:MAG: class I SAM-dependent methyltransferase [Thermoguttaceae bacterium]